MTQDLQREHIDRAVSRYSSLFTLPSHKKITMLLCIQCVVTGIATELPYDLSFPRFFVGLVLGIVLLSATLLGNYVTARIFLKKDLVLDLRRISFLSLASNLVLLLFAFIATMASASLGDPNVWFKITSLGIFASLSLRFLVFYSVSFVGSGGIFFSSVLQPALFMVPILSTTRIPLGLQSYSLLYYTVAVFAAFLGVRFFIASLNTASAKALGIPSIRMFKAFFASWAGDLEKPLEEILEQLSEERGIKVSTIAFKTAKGMKAAMVVPSLHPGPFKNVGSSPLPGLIQKALEKKLGCVVSVPHGISGHELDLASQAQNERILNRILEASEFNNFHPYATQFQSLRKDSATAGCQIFGDCALLTLTLAPGTMEDLPIELNDIVAREAKKKGLTSTIAIDAHNSLQGPFEPEKAIAPIKKAAATALMRTSTGKQSLFEVGAAKLIPPDLSVKEGIGLGGITVVITKVGSQKTAYVTIDGNNMVSGLREKILSGLQELGLSGGEILTTDTHVVNAVVIGRRGYHPVGEVIDHNRLVQHIKTAATEALGNLEPAEASWRQEEIQGVRVIGERQISNLCLMVDEVASRAKKTSAAIFPALGLSLITLLVLL